jgi:hypothetical protein
MELDVSQYGRTHTILSSPLNHSEGKYRLLFSITIFYLQTTEALVISWIPGNRGNATGLVYIIPVYIS